MPWLGRELRVALRVLWQRPVFAFVAIASIAIGITANTTIFSVVNAVLLRAPGGMVEPSAAIEIGRTNGGRGFDTFSYRELLAMRESGTPLDIVAAWTLAPLSFSPGGERGERLLGFMVSHDYFAALGVAPARGRFFLEDEDRAPVGATVVVLSHRFWRDRLGGDPAAIGRTILINRTAFTVIGIAPEEFVGHIPVARPDVYLPLTAMPIANPGFDGLRDDRSSWLIMVGRLSPGATIAQADAAARAVMAGLQSSEAQTGRERGARVVALGAVPGGGRGPVTAFLGLVGAFAALLLLITCANVAGMQIARSIAREREIAVRLALGSSRTQLVRQLLVESLLLFLAGGTAGVILAGWVTRLVSSISLPSPFPITLDFRPDAGVIAFGLGLALLTGLVFGLLPALQSTRFGVVAALKADATRSGSSTARLRHAFVSGQIGFSLLLLVAAGLLLRALSRAGEIDVGFDATGVQAVSFDLSLDGYDEQRGLLFHRRLLERVRTMPGVVAAGLAADLPLDLSESGTAAWPETGPAAGDGLGVAFNIVSDGYAEAIGLRVLRGRSFTAADRQGNPAVVLVSRSFVTAAWPGEDGLELRLRFGDTEAPWLTVIGVVDDAKNQTLMEESRPMVYLPVAQSWNPATYLVIRSSPPGAVAPASIVQAIRSVDPDLATGAVQSLADITAVGVLPQRAAASVAATLGLLALVLCTMGVYGVGAFTVARRTREVGVRMALGASRRDVIGLVLRGGLRLAAPGVAIGLLAALALGRVMQSLLLGVSPVDPLTFVGVPLLLATIVAMACVTPARRAAGIQPTLALRSD
ncbi:MAG: ABC transporter permease [Gemmatimonadetes bacterium]|nr:ABC transporter permease [Gemmatimonadota bacterium]